MQLKSNSLRKDLVFFFKDTKCDSTIQCAFSKVPNLKTMVYSYLEVLKRSRLVEIDDMFVIIFGGNKGGEMKSDFSKFPFNIVKMNYSSFCIYEYAMHK